MQAVTHYVLRYTGRGEIPAADRKLIDAKAGVTVLDASPRMLLIQAPKPTAARLARRLPAWVLSPERIVPIPDARPKIRS